MIFHIERNVPVPAMQYNHKSTVAAMNVGDSYKVELDKNKVPNVYSAFKAQGKRCTIRKQHGKVYRVWRIA